jgi:hypothetical protein
MTLPDRELEAKQEILQVLGHLDEAAQRRVASWVYERIVGDKLTSVVGGVLTSVVGGVVSEPIRFDLKVLTYRLSEPASAVRSITGTSSGLSRTFLVAIDFVFSGTATSTVVWRNDGTKPDDDTTFFVDYFRVESRSQLSGLDVGSVTRALAEAVARELAAMYEQLNLAYQSAFVDTATGESLDHIVAILDVFRETAKFAEGRVTFFRAPRLEGNVTIPAGTRLASTGGSVMFVSTEPRTLQRRRVRIDVPVRADVGFAGEIGVVKAGTITEMSQPVAGIERVSNLDPTTIRTAADETDDELRIRARAALRRSAKRLSIHGTA